MWISGRIGISLFHSFPRVTLYLKSDRNESLVALEVKSNYSIANCSCCSVLKNDESKMSGSLFPFF